MVGCALAHQQKGGLRCVHNLKRGVLGAGTAPKKGKFRTGSVNREGVRN